MSMRYRTNDETRAYSILFTSSKGGHLSHAVRTCGSEGALVLFSARAKSFIVTAGCGTVAQPSAGSLSLIFNICHASNLLV